ncbi:hypothetical protein NPX79_02850 [Spiroplasma endosymbiont of Anurida maritima]|uniref:hypothetical protein n=1 Tax=Spiroplasma endosymbiont of Anurida maritima TaxID=2967972 RepID=UPI0036D3479A
MLINNLNNIKHVLTVPHEEKPAFGVDIIFTTSPVKVDGKEEYHLWIKPSLVHLKKYEDFNHHVHVGNFFKNYIKSQNKSLWWNSLHVKKLSVSININNKIYKNAVFDTTNPRFSPLIDLNKNYKNNSFKRYSFDAKNFYKKRY